MVAKPDSMDQALPSVAFLNDRDGTAGGPGSLRSSRTTQA
jgi:hypothetical protein